MSKIYPCMKKNLYKGEEIMHTVDGGGKMELKMLLEEDEVVDGSLGPKRWSKLVGVDEEEPAPPTFFLLFLFSMSFATKVYNSHLL